MSEDSTKFMKNLLVLGFEVEIKPTDSGYPETKDVEDMGPQDHFISRAVEEVKVFRGSEHYFALVVHLKSGGWINLSAPISRYHMWGNVKENGKELSGEETTANWKGE
jgi:hypothetical protein